MRGNDPGCGLCLPAFAVGEAKQEWSFQRFVDRGVYLSNGGRLWAWPSRMPQRFEEGFLVDSKTCPLFRGNQGAHLLREVSGEGSLLQHPCLDRKSTRLNSSH